MVTPAGAPRQVCVDAGSALHAPDSLSDHEAAGLMEATLTAYLNIFEVGHAQPGQLVLIHGGGSGAAPAECGRTWHAGAALAYGVTAWATALQLRQREGASRRQILLQALSLCKAKGVRTLVTAGRWARASDAAHGLRVSGVTGWQAMLSSALQLTSVLDGQ